MKLDRKQDLNFLYQVCVFRADQKTKMAALADSSKRWHIVLRCTICGPLGLLLIFSKHASNLSYFEGNEIEQIITTLSVPSLYIFITIYIDLLYTWTVVAQMQSL